MTKKEILDYVVNTPGNTNRAVLSDMLDGISEGSSEDSDFTTANITFSVREGEEYHIGGLVTIKNNEIYMLSDELIADSTTFVVPLYKGKYAWEIYSEDMNFEVEPTMTGGVSVDYDSGALVFTGDGTFTAAGTRNV